MTDPVTNALAVQMEYGDDDLKEAIEKRIRALARDAMLDMMKEPAFLERIIVNNASTFNRQVIQAVRECLHR